jgi:PAS domain S-box-containing protein
MVLAGSITTLFARWQRPVRLIFFAFVVMAVSRLQGAASTNEAPLVFLGDKGYPPVTYLEDGIAKGMDVDLAKALAAPLHQAVRIELMDWDLAQEKVLKGEAGALTGLTITEDRQKLFDFAEPTLTREFGFVVRNGAMTIHGLADVKGKRVGVTAGGFPRKFMTTQPDVNLVVIDDYQDGFNRLKAGKIDVVAADLWVAAYLIEKHDIYGVTVVGKPFATAQEAIAVKKGDTALLNEINEGIRALKADGTLSGIERNWRPEEMVFASRQKIRNLTMAFAGGVLLIVLGVMSAWILTLKRQIKTRKQAESALRESEARFRGYFELAAVGFSITSREKRLLAVNSEYCRITGYPEDELLEKTWSELTHPEDMKDNEKLFEQALAGKIDAYTLNKRFVRKDGGIIHATISVRCVRRLDGSPDYFVSLLLDVTERELAVQREAQARAEYTLQLIASQEAERSRIAAELHDSLGQNLLLIKNHALLALADKTAPAAFSGRLEDISTLAAAAIDEVRQISHDLHPYQLDHLGFTRALEAMIEGAAQSSGIIFERKLDPADGVFPKDAMTNLYRIVQESLNNILKHSGAKRVRIELECDVREVQLRIEDDGHGFNVQENGNGGKGMGLKNIAERTRILNGTLAVDSQPGRGTRIVVTIPIAEAG